MHNSSNHEDCRDMKNSKLSIPVLRDKNIIIDRDTLSLIDSDNFYIIELELQLLIVLIDPQEHYAGFILSNKALMYQLSIMLC